MTGKQYCRSVIVWIQRSSFCTDFPYSLISYMIKKHFTEKLELNFVSFDQKFIINTSVTILCFYCFQCVINSSGLRKIN